MYSRWDVMKLFKEHFVEYDLRNQSNQYMSVKYVCKHQQSDFYVILLVRSVPWFKHFAVLVQGHLVTCPKVLRCDYEN